jgi:glycosyltransferase involved in cell wall biosynthesis
MKTPFLSIITVNRNNADGLSRTLESAFAQDWTDYEYIVIDGASTDESPNIINLFKSKLSYWVSEPDRGIYDAMNKGIMQAKGEYCIFMNSGDVFADKSCLKEVCGQVSGEDFIFGDILMDMPNGKIKTWSYPDILSFGYLVDNSPPHQAMLIKTSLLQSAGGYRTDFKIAADWLLVMEALFKKNATYKRLHVPIAIFATDGVSWGVDGFLQARRERELALQALFPLTYPEIQEYVALKKLFKVPGIRFLLYRAYPFYRKLRNRFDGWEGR